MHKNFYSLFDAGTLSIGNCRQTLVLGPLTGLTTLWRIVEVFITKEDLFTDAPKELTITVDAYDRLIDKFRPLLGDRGCGGLCRF